MAAFRSIALTHHGGSVSEALCDSVSSATNVTCGKEKGMVTSSERRLRKDERTLGTRRRSKAQRNNPIVARCCDLTISELSSKLRAAIALEF